MSVPAWPIPIHQTKLTMAKPHPTGALTPQMPMPRDEEHADGEEQHHRQQEPDREADRPEERGLARQDDRGDLVGDRAEGVARADDLPAVAGRRRRREIGSLMSSSSPPTRLPRAGLGLRTAARYVVRGRVPSSSRRP